MLGEMRGGQQFKTRDTRIARTIFELNYANWPYASISYLPVDAIMFRSVVVHNKLLSKLLRGGSISASTCLAFSPIPLKKHATYY